MHADHKEGGHRIPLLVRHVFSIFLQQSPVEMVHPTPWCVFLPCCFLNLYTCCPLWFHTFSMNVPSPKLLKFVVEVVEVCGMAFPCVALSYAQIQRRRFHLFCWGQVGVFATSMGCRGGWRLEWFKKPTSNWWVKLGMRCEATQFMALVDMVTHNIQK